MKLNRVEVNMNFTTGEEIANSISGQRFIYREHGDLFSINHFFIYKFSALSCPKKGEGEKCI